MLTVDWKCLQEVEIRPFTIYGNLHLVDGQIEDLSGEELEDI